MNFIPKIVYNELVTGIEKTVQFDSPPEGDPLGERYRAIQTSRRSTAGVRQTQHNYNLLTYRLKFIFQLEDTYQDFKDFYLNHASKGGSFKYYIHSDEVEYEVFEFKMGTFNPKRPIPSATLGEFEYDFNFQIEKVL